MPSPRSTSWWTRWRSGRQSGAVVLAYHSIGQWACDPSGQAVSPRTFERQLRLLQRRATVIPARALMQRLQEGSPVDGLAAVTFDDGYADTLSTALPIATRSGVPITVFVTTEPVVEGRTFWWDVLAASVLHARAGVRTLPHALAGADLSLAGDASREQVYATLHRRLRSTSALERAASVAALESLLPGDPDATAHRPLTVAELQTLAAAADVEIGAHTVSHPSLATRPFDEQHHELVESRRVLEALLGRPVLLVAYPFGKPGDVSATTRRAAAAAGYHAGFTTVPRAVRGDADPLALPRLTMHEWHDREFEDRLDTLLGDVHA